MTDFGSALIVTLTIAVGLVCVRLVWRACTTVVRAVISDVARTAADAVREERK